MTSCRWIHTKLCDNPAIIFVRHGKSPHYDMIAFCDICWDICKKRIKEEALRLKREIISEDIFLGSMAVFISENEYLMIMEMQS